MKVILTQDIKSVGKKGQIIDAADGYARNFLLPKKMAAIADNNNLNELKTKQDANKYRRDMSKANAEELAKKMKDFEFWFVTGSQHLYGPETLAQVAKDSAKMVEGLNASGKMPCKNNDKI